MADKQIVIDSIDVSGCVKLRPYNECGCQPNYGGSYGLCSEWGNCYYKQLKHKEQELEQYKKSKQASYEALQKMCNELELENRKLKAENERLERQIEAERKDNWSVRGQLGEAECLLCRYDRTLTEIKEIAEEQKDVLESMRIDIAEQILNKISEVLDENI